MLSQVLGMLFGPKDQVGSTSSDKISISHSNTDAYSLSSHKVKKRGRPPSLDRVYSVPSVDSLSNNSSLSPTENDMSEGGVEMLTMDIPKRKRGRPPKSASMGAIGIGNNYYSNSNHHHHHGNHANSLLIPVRKIQHRSELKLISGNNDFNSDFGYGMKNLGSVRRSRRYKPPEPFKEMIVIHPEDDPIIRLNVPPPEVEEFKLCMDDPIDMDDEEQQQQHHHHHQLGLTVQDSSSLAHGPIVFTPGVSEIHDFTEIYAEKPIQSSLRKHNVSLLSLNLSSTRRLNNTSSSSSSSSSSYGYKHHQLPMGETLPGYSYSEYDADSDDEEFIHKINNSLNHASSLNNNVNNSNSSNYHHHHHHKKLELSISIFRTMFAVLEREYELSRAVQPLLDESIRLESEAAKLIDDCSTTLSWMKAFVDSLSENGEITPATETLITVASRNLHNHNVRIDSVSGDDPMYLLPPPIHPLSTNSEFSMPSIPTPLSSIVNVGFRNNIEEEAYNPKLLSSNQIREYLSNSNLFDFLFDIFVQECNLGSILSSTHGSSSSGGSITTAHETSYLTSTEPLIVLIRNVISQVYEYYIQKRSTMRFSSLRCYHDFMMENWHRHSSIIPLGPHDLDMTYISQQESRLLALRKDLDRARLITDRVRRREKIKRDIIRITSEYVSTNSNLMLNSSKRQSIKDDNMEEEYDFALEYIPYSDIIFDTIRESNVTSTTNITATGSSTQNSSLHSVIPSTTASNSTALVSETNQESQRGRGRPRLGVSIDIPNIRALASSSNRQNTSLHSTSSDDQPLPKQTRTIGSNSSNSNSSNSNSTNNNNNNNSNSSYNSHNHNSHKGNSSFSNWSRDEDKLLLLGVAACGLGRWTEIREDFSLQYRSSAQMNQRFFRLTKRRKQYIESLHTSSKTQNQMKDVNARDANTSVIGSGDGDVITTVDDDNLVSEDTDPTLLSTEMEDLNQSTTPSRNDLSPTLVSLLMNFCEDEVWNRISLRYLLDMHQHERRSGRPVKHPIQIPIPTEYRQRGFLKYKHLLSRRPSSPSFKLPISNHSTVGIDIIHDHSERSFMTTCASSPSISCDISVSSNPSDSNNTNSSNHNTNQVDSKESKSLSSNSSNTSNNTTSSKRISPRLHPTENNNLSSMEMMMLPISQINSTNSVSNDENIELKNPSRRQAAIQSGYLR